MPAPGARNRAQRRTSVGLAGGPIAALRDFQTRQLGTAGEEWVIDLEREASAARDGRISPIGSRGWPAEALAHDPRRIDDLDEAHSEHETRWTVLAMAPAGVVLRVTTVDRGDTVRIISARRASVPERTRYEQEPR